MCKSIFLSSFPVIAQGCICVMSGVGIAMVRDAHNLGNISVKLADPLLPKAISPVFGRDWVQHLSFNSFYRRQLICLCLAPACFMTTQTASQSIARLIKSDSNVVILQKEQTSLHCWENKWGMIFVFDKCNMISGTKNDPQNNCVK